MKRIKTGPEEVKTGVNKTGFRKLTAILALIILVLTSYSRVFDNEFVDWDDFTYVVDNELVRNSSGSMLKEIFTTPVSSNYHPLTVLSLHLNNNNCPGCPHGISPAPFIRWNLILHIINILLVFWFISLLCGRSLFIPFFTAAVFGIHPMHVESVAWISERKDVLYSFFFLAGLVSWIYYRKNHNKKVVFYLLTLILFISSCLSKAVAVVFPVVLILIDYWLEPETEKAGFLKVARHLISGRRLLLLLPFLAVSLFIGLQAYFLQDGRNFPGLLHVEKRLPDMVNTAVNLNLSQRIGTGFYGLAAYMLKFFLPFGLSAIYPYPSTEILNSFRYSLMLSGMAVIAVVSAVLIIRSMGKTKIFAFGTGLYLVTVILVLQIISVGIAIRADRYTYLPYIGPAFVLASIIQAGFGEKIRRVLFVAAGVFLILLWFLTFRRVDVWQNTEVLWSDTIKRFPELETPRSSRGKYYTRMSLKAKSESEKKLYEEKALADFLVAIKSKPLKTDVYEGTGYLYALKGDFRKAVEFFNAALIIDNENGSAYYNRALAYTSLGMVKEAINDYDMALRYRPQQARAIITNRSSLLLETGRFSEAISDLDYLISIEPLNPDHYFNRSTARIVTGNRAGAVDDLRAVLKLSPGDREAAERLKMLTQQ
ncbi:MAG TPA: tetratricopeptide repeat protein [Bacteroidales bacterium]|nr:tetratricopeptide repeat protein [Bacteroidales bacterium]HQG55758.1 tetratricopeptide repeat protein [Bacteroidales bacterium]HRR92344.1 tetratricopeptide repeat protein [Bacteroidales bacterium]HRT88496.1 tetratricopeptide repeat protein [Bacteroidales bacterium]